MVKTQPRRQRSLSKKERIHELRLLLRICFELMDDPDPKEISNRTGLSVSTIWRLGTSTPSLKTHYNTIKSMVEAAGLDCTMSEGRYILRLKNHIK